MIISRSKFNESKICKFGAVFSSAQNQIIKAHFILLDMLAIDVLPCLWYPIPDSSQIHLNLE